MNTRALKTLGELKSAIKGASKVYVWCNWMGDDGDYIEVSKAKFLKSIGADCEPSGTDLAHGGRDNGTQADFRVENGEVYVN